MIVSHPLLRHDYHRCNKLYGIHTVDFGAAGGRTCRWKTSTCFKVCYGRHGHFDKRSPAISTRILTRLRWLEKQSGSAIYEAMTNPTGKLRAFRIGRVGDCSNPDYTSGVVYALLEQNVPFMWPTRAWRDPDHPSWRLIDYLLPGQVHCSIDVTTVQRGEVPPPGYPQAFIAEPTTGWWIPEGFTWCPHYPKPGELVRSVLNCYECGICYRRPGEKDRPHIAFALHTSGGVPMFYVHELRQRAKGLSEWDAGEADYPTCGIMTPEGWNAPFDDV